MRRTTTKVEGFRELERALRELPKATAGNVLDRTLQKMIKPISEPAKAAAPQFQGKLEASLVVGKKLSKRQAKFARREGKAYRELHFGTNDSAGTQQEFGNVNHGPQPFMRPAWESGKERALDIGKNEMGNEIGDAAARLSRKAARLAAKG